MEITKLLKAIGDESDLKSLDCYYNINGKSIIKRLGLSESAISQHIKVLKEVACL